VGSASAGLGLTGGGVGAASKLNNEVGSAADHASADDLYATASSAVAESNIAHAFVGLGTALTVSSDLASGRSVAYTTGDAVGGGLGGWGGAAVGTAVCGGPEDGIGIVCGLAGGIIGGLGGGKLMSRAAQGLVNWMENG
jgi:hypothetical protein